MVNEREIIENLLRENGQLRRALADAAEALREMLAWVPSDQGRKALVNAIEALS